MATTLAQLDAHVAAAIAADAAGDYASAATSARAALLTLGGLPDVTRNLRGGSQALAFPSGELFTAYLDRVARTAKAAAVSSGGPFAQSEITYVAEDLS